MNRDIKNKIENLHPEVKAKLIKRLAAEQIEKRILKRAFLIEKLSLLPLDKQDYALKKIEELLNKIEQENI